MWQNIRSESSLKLVWYHQDRRWLTQKSDSAFKFNDVNLTLKKILVGVAVMTRDFEVAVQWIDFSRRPLAERELVDTMWEIVGVVIDHDG